MKQTTVAYYIVFINKKIILTSIKIKSKKKIDNFKLSELKDVVLTKNEMPVVKDGETFSASVISVQRVIQNKYNNQEILDIRNKTMREFSLKNNVSYFDLNKKQVRNAYKEIIG